MTELESAETKKAMIYILEFLKFQKNISTEGPSLGYRITRNAGILEQFGSLTFGFDQLSTWFWFVHFLHFTTLVKMLVQRIEKSLFTSRTYVFWQLCSLFYGVFSETYWTHNCPRERFSLIWIIRLSFNQFGRQKPLITKRIKLPKISKSIYAKWK